MKRAGFTVIELLIAITIFAVVVGAALELLSVQTRGMARGADRVNATQNLQYAVGSLTRDVRTVGTSVPAGQPFLVYADSEVVAFNADYLSNSAGDPSAVYYDPVAPNGAVMAIGQADRLQLPLSSFNYPDTTYWQPGGSNSPAELIVFFLRPDSTTARLDDYVLMRQANDLPPELVSRNLLRSQDGRPFFQYFRLVRDSTGPQIDSVAASALPLAHSVPLHLSPADTAAAATIDSIRGVRVSLAATDGGSAGASELIRSVSRIIWLRNAGQAQLKVCGSVPIFGAFATAAVLDDAGEAVVQISWTPAVDEVGGEQDVIRYVVWRRMSGASSWGVPYLSVPAGSATYSHIDRSVVIGETYEYAVAAQDCTPTLSSSVVVGPVGPIALP